MTMDQWHTGPVTPEASTRTTTSAREALAPPLVVPLAVQLVDLEKRGLVVLGLGSGGRSGRALVQDDEAVSCGRDRRGW